MSRTNSRKSGTLIIIGGHEDHEGEKVILKEVASHISNGRLVLATVASHEPEGYLENYQAAFGELGINQVSELYVQDRTEAGDEAKLAVLDDVTAVFFLRWRPAPHYQPNRRHANSATYR